MKAGPVIAALLAACGCATQFPKPPAQPATGPGGSDYRHEKVQKHKYGSYGTQYWLFEPAAPAPTNAPVIVFLHGWPAMYPHFYEAWIEHLVRRGNIVIYPRYQTNLLTPLDRFTPNALTTIKAALIELQSDRHVRPDTNHVAVVGHSMGAVIAANYAAVAAAEGLPQPKAILCVEPQSGVPRHSNWHMPWANWSKIPPATLLLLIVGEDDRVAGQTDARRIFTQTTQIPTDNKNFITMPSDHHGRPALLANHHAPLAAWEPDGPNGPTELRRPSDDDTLRDGTWISPIDALDWYGFWKLADALTDAAFFGKNREYALGNTPEQRSLGRWSDGTTVKELRVITPEPPRP